ncbi:S8 family serine peptidase [Marinobacter sp. SS13-12]|uniref:S8 family peptidase n=1 Tax=Marinobacter sp. SS13-12 TaxID=3050451 RepID=UPI0025563578|nr:S8 family serine peptidase [Marinobacter sp. SS13-12]MDK8465901.1 S8 family serine peptidase [Marinobacter sp. SS13-12]
MPFNSLLRSLGLLFFSLTVSASDAPRQVHKDSQVQQQTDEKISFVVRYAEGELSAQSVGKKKRTNVVSVSPEDADGYAAYLEQQPGVLSVERDLPASNPRMPKAPITLPPGVMSAQSITDSPNDPGFSDQYAWQAPTDAYPGTHDILAATQKSIQTRKVRIGVADSGFHQVSDLIYAGGYNFSEIDGPGADFYTPQIDPSCTNSHGTAVAGIIAATTNNFNGVAGIVDTELYAARVMSCGSGYLSDLASGIYWLAGQPTGSAPTLAEPVDIINASMGSQSSTCPAYLQDAIDFAVSRNILVVVAAGNESMDASNYTPANCRNVVSVGSIDRRGNQSDFSNYGAEVDVAALGELVRTLNGEGKISLWFGTSFATPNAAGIAGLLKQQSPTLSPDRLALRLKEATRYPEVLSSSSFKGGIIDANLMITQFQRELSETMPDFKPALAKAERCHRSAYLDTSPDPTKLEALYELTADNLTLNNDDEYFTVFQYSKNQLIEDAKVVNSSRESKFLVQNVNPGENRYLFDICQKDGTGCVFGRSLELITDGTTTMASACGS